MTDTLPPGTLIKCGSVILRISKNQHQLPPCQDTTLNFDFMDRYVFELPRELDWVEVQQWSQIPRQQITQQHTILEAAYKCIPKGWEDVFESAFPELCQIDELLSDESGDTFYPLKKDLFRAFHLVEPQNVRVVIVGQDPYHNTQSDCADPRAQGLSFSVHREDNIPPSLRNIFKELLDSINGFSIPSHGDLSEWCQQGVLLLNRCLTVKPGQPGSHGDMWMPLISRILTRLNANPHKIVYLLLGAEAKKIETELGDKGIIIHAPHPSGANFNGGFLGSKAFKQVNNALIRYQQQPIDWRLSEILPNQ